MTPQNKDLIERCEATLKLCKKTKAIQYNIDFIKGEFADLLNRFKELEMVDLDEVEKLVKTNSHYVRIGSEMWREPFNIEAYQEQLRVKIGYTTQHLNTEGEG